MQQTMTSLEFLNTIINPARIKAGESLIENRKFILKMVDELDISETDFYSVSISGAQRPVKVVNLDHDQMLLIGMRESKAVRKVVLARLRELEETAKRPLSTLELLELATQEIKAKTKESADKSIATMTVTDIANRMDIKPKEVNHLLLTKGLQTRTFIEGKPSYHLTSEGIAHGIEGNSKNAKVSQLRWRETVLDILVN